MKTVLVLISMLLGSLAFAGETSVPVEFELISAQAACQERCNEDGDCRYSVRFADEDFALINELKEETGLYKTWFQKSPFDMCTDGDLPAFGEGFSQIDVLLYSVDLSELADLF